MTLDPYRAALRDLTQPDRQAIAAACARDAQLTKPAGSLGRLAGIAAFLAGWQGTDRPVIDRPHVAVFAGNHGVAAPGRAKGAVSAFPAEVTAQMVGNFQAGGAAVNQLAAAAGAGFSVTPLDLDRPTQDLSEGPALTESECAAAMDIGAAAVPEGCDLLVPGEMGIGNTTAAAAICHAILGGAAADWTGRGTGVDDAGLAAKTAAVADGAATNRGARGLAALAALGGRELAAMAGAILEARRRRIPVLLDGFICSAAALTLHDEAPGTLDHCLAGHLSAEAAHGRLLAALGLQPVLSLDLRLGEGSGGALAIPIIRAAAACQSGMATFAEAAVASGSQGQGEAEVR